MFETSPKIKKAAASAVAAGALLVGAETAQAHPAPLDGPTPAVASANAVGGVSAGFDPIKNHNHLVSQNRIQTDPSRGDIGGEGGDPLAPDQNGKGGDPNSPMR